MKHNFNNLFHNSEVSMLSNFNFFAKCFSFCALTPGYDCGINAIHAIQARDKQIQPNKERNKQTYIQFLIPYHPIRESFISSRCSCNMLLQGFPFSTREFSGDPGCKVLLQGAPIYMVQGSPFSNR